jgi:tRNA(Ile)-lysidine synthase
VENVMLGVFSPKGFWLAQSDYIEQGGWQPSLVSDCRENSPQSFSNDE